MKKIVVTGGAGFIGSNIVAALAKLGTYDVVVCDRFGSDDKWRNLRGHVIWDIVTPEILTDWLNKHTSDVEAIIHTGGISSTTERDIDLILRENLSQSIVLWRWCNQNNVRFIYTSSSATYGNGSEGFDDDISLEYLRKLKPLSGYGWSKHLFDMHVASAVAKGDAKLPQWVGLKVFNTYGPNEYHKEAQRSVICQITPQAALGAAVRLFKSYHPQYPDGGQMRDVIYVKDVVDVVLWSLRHPAISGMFNLGTGKASSFNDMASCIFNALDKKPNIHYTDMPEGLMHNYQYFTEAKMDRLRTAGYTVPFTSLADGVRDYVVNYLTKDDPYL
jgi:ADP-L-glycero-D-manno-heptose 6-epimerase